MFTILFCHGSFLTYSLIQRFKMCVITHLVRDIIIARKPRIRFSGLFSERCRQAPIPWEDTGCISHCAWWWQMEGGEWCWKMKASMERSRHAGGGQTWKRDAFPVCLTRSWCSGVEWQRPERVVEEKSIYPHLINKHFTRDSLISPAFAVVWNVFIEMFFFPHTFFFFFYCFQHILLNWRSNSWDASAAQ